MRSALATETPAVPASLAGAAAMLLDKPAGITSHDLVRSARNQTGMKAGHAGTLDPFATGLMIVLLGRATRLQRYLVGLPKTYLATARLGWRSSTGDSDGEIEFTGVFPDDPSITTGDQDQMVPMTSAARVDGERLYRAAHRGETIEARPVRRITVHSSTVIEQIGEGEDQRMTFELKVSSGTYIRNLVETLGDAYCEQLRRTAVGEFGVERAGEVLSPLEVLSHLPAVELDPDARARVLNGRALDLDETGVESGSAVRMVADGTLIAVGRLESGRLSPEVVLGSSE